jgi:hypothetical protein
VADFGGIDDHTVLAVQLLAPQRFPRRAAQRVGCPVEGEAAPVEERPTVQIVHRTVGRHMRDDALCIQRLGHEVEGPLLDLNCPNQDLI